MASFRDTPTLYWYKVETNRHKEGPYHYIGASPLKPDELIGALTRGEFLHLTHLVYVDQGRYRDWSDWDHTVVPTVYIKSECVLSVMPLQGDPRTMTPPDTTAH
jgi:hypothetical protein